MWSTWVDVVAMVIILAGWPSFQREVGVIVGRKGAIVQYGSSGFCIYLTAVSISQEFCTARCLSKYILRKVRDSLELTAGWPVSMLRELRIAPC